MNGSPSFNPYQAPTSHEPEDVTLSDDAEFLISSREILCRESVSLPKVCIHTGRSENLQRRMATFHSADALVAGLIVPGAFLAMLFAGSMLGIGLIALIVLGLSGAAVLPLLARLRFPGISSIEATWYVSEDYLRRCRWQQWVIRGTIVAFMFFVGFALGHSTTTVGVSPVVRGLQTGIALAAFCGALSLTLKMERKMRYSSRRRRGPHKGLFALTGHSPQFTESVERIIHGGF